MAVAGPGPTTEAYRRSFKSIKDEKDDEEEEKHGGRSGDQHQKARGGSDDNDNDNDNAKGEDEDDSSSQSLPSKPPPPCSSHQARQFLAKETSRATPDVLATNEASHDIEQA